MNLTPSHPQTVNALARAAYLADVYAPSTKPQQAAHQQLVDAIRSGNLYQTVEAVQAAGETGRKGLATVEWASWAELWLNKVRAKILSDVELERAA